MLPLTMASCTPSNNLHRNKAEKNKIDVFPNLGKSITYFLNGMLLFVHEGFQDAPFPAVISILTDVLLTANKKPLGWYILIDR